MSGARVGRAPTNNDIMRLLEDLTRKFEASERDRASHRDRTSDAMQRLAETSRITAEAVEKIEEKLGEEPNSDGSGGKGLIGDLRKHGRDLQSLLDLRRMALGAVAAVTLFGTLIVLGAVQWIEGIVKGANS